MFKSLISGICCVLTIPPQLTVGSTLNGSRNRPLARIFSMKTKELLKRKMLYFLVLLITEEKKWVSITIYIPLMLSSPCLFLVKQKSTSLFFVIISLSCFKWKGQIRFRIARHFSIWLAEITPCMQPGWSIESKYGHLLHKPPNPSCMRVLARPGWKIAIMCPQTAHCLIGLFTMLRL